MKTHAELITSLSASQPVVEMARAMVDEAGQAEALEGARAGVLDGGAFVAEAALSAYLEYGGSPGVSGLDVLHAVCAALERGI